MDVKTSIERAIAEKGSEQKLGDATGYSQVAINKAKQAGKVSPEMAIAIARATSVPLSCLAPSLVEAVRAELKPSDRQ